MFEEKLGMRKREDRGEGVRGERGKWIVRMTERQQENENG
jgi:hypothetical protein